MNLTRLRDFQFDTLVLEMYEKYKGRLDQGPDQDIINIIFGSYKGHSFPIPKTLWPCLDACVMKCFLWFCPDNATIMDCNYAFHPEHCGGRNGREYHCPHHSVGEGPLCFCWPALVNGVKLIHAYGRTFQGMFVDDFQPNFMQSLWSGFQEVTFQLGRFPARKTNALGLCAGSTRLCCCIGENSGTEGWLCKAAQTAPVFCAYPSSIVQERGGIFTENYFTRHMI